MKTTPLALRVTAAVFACLLVILSAVLFTVHLCFLNEDNYIKAILTEDFYDEVALARAQRLEDLGTMMELDSAVFDKYISEAECKELAGNYVRALVSDLLNNTNTAADIKFTSKPLLDYIKADYADYDFTESGYPTSDKAAEAAYGMVCNQINAAVLFVPETIRTNLSGASRLLELLSRFTAFWWAPLVLAVGLYAIVVFTAETPAGGRFGASASFWCASVVCFVPVVILFFGSDLQYLEFDRNVLYCFISGCIKAVRGNALMINGVFFAGASICLTVTGLMATAPRTLIVPEPAVAADAYSGEDEDERA